LGGSGKQEFVICTARAAQSEPSQAKDALKMSKEHFHLLS
jgi:hypothetical protein